MKRWVMVVNFLLFLALCASAAAWVMQLFKPASRPVAAAPVPETATVVPLQAASALFGARTTSATASNYVLRGVVVARRPADSVAIIVAEGKPPQAVRLGAEVAPGVAVKEVHPQFVLLSEGGRERRLELPEKSSP